MLTADYHELAAGESTKKLHDVQIEIKGTQVINERSESTPYISVRGFPDYSDKQNADPKGWLNYHIRVFRAQSDHAELTISDWPSPDNPGKYPKQELMCNFIEVQPYLAPYQN